MSETLEDATLGRIIFTDRALTKMKQHGLYHYQIVETLKRGFFVTSIVDGLRQKHLRISGEKEIGLLFTQKDTDTGEPLGAILVISCWARNQK